MKKMISIALALCLALVLCACGGKNVDIDMEKIWADNEPMAILEDSGTIICDTVKQDKNGNEKGETTTRCALIGGIFVFDSVSYDENGDLLSKSCAYMNDLNGGSYSSIAKDKKNIILYPVNDYNKCALENWVVNEGILSENVVSAKEKDGNITIKTELKDEDNITCERVYTISSENGRIISREDTYKNEKNAVMYVSKSTFTYAEEFTPDLGAAEVLESGDTSNIQIYADGFIQVYNISKDAAVLFDSTSGYKLYSDIEFMNEAKTVDLSEDTVYFAAK